MKIFYLDFTDSGCSKWRAQIPSKYLERRGHVVKLLYEGLSSECPDVIVFSRQYGADVSRLFNWAKDRGIRVVYDTDDAWDLTDPWNPAYSFSKKAQREATFIASNADVVTTTTPELAATLRKYNSNVVVIPNSVDPEDWTVKPRSRNERIHIGWLGGSTHFLDLAIAADAISELSRKRNFGFTIYGLTPLTSVEDLYRGNLQRLGESFRNSHLGKAIKVFLRKTENLKYEFQPFVATSEYAATLCHLRFDIGIAPLADTAFNRNKSCIKYYEYGMSGAVTLASNVLPYSTEVPMVCENKRSAWKERLTELMDSDLQSLWKMQYEWIMTYRNIETNVSMWEDIFAGSKASSVPREVPRNGDYSMASV